MSYLNMAENGDISSYVKKTKKESLYIFNTIKSY